MLLGLRVIIEQLGRRDALAGHDLDERAEISPLPRQDLDIALLDELAKRARSRLDDRLSYRAVGDDIPVVDEERVAEQHREEELSVELVHRREGASVPRGEVIHEPAVSERVSMPIARSRHGGHPTRA